MLLRKNKFTLFLLFSLLLTGNVFSQQINPNILYKIVSPAGFAIDNLDSKANEVEIFLGKDQKGKEGQVWKITPAGNGFYLITNPFYDKSIDNDNKSSGNENPVIQWDASPTNENQLWKFTVIVTGEYTITQRNSGMALAFTGEEAAEATIYQLPNVMQTWRLIPTTMKAPKEIKVKRGKNNWANETIFAVNKEPGHVTYIPFSSVESLKADNIKFYGRGSHENYSDRKHSAFFGLYETTVKGMEAEHYVRSQSMGNRGNIRRFTLTDNDGKGLKVSSKDRLSFMHFISRIMSCGRPNMILCSMKYVTPGSTSI